MAKNQDTMIEQLIQRNEELKGSMSLGATSLLTFPTYNDSARMIMFASHVTQRVVLNKTEFPRVYTNFENIIGNYSSYNRRAESEYKVIEIIDKFPTIESARDVQNRLLVVYDKINDLYDIIERHDVEDLTEKYGFQYDNSGINKYSVGDTIPKGATLSRPTSYDQYDNYGFGRNIKFMYQCNQDTIEDAVVVSESLSKLMESTEVEEVKVPINDNDILSNYYGDSEHYKSFPDVGEHTKDKIICVKKRINGRQILYDLKNSNTEKILGSDTPSYIEGVVSDIDIFFNKPFEELNRGIFNSQLNYYIEMIYDFYTRIRDITQNIIDSGYRCTDNLLYWNKRVKELLNPEFKCKDELGNVPSNIVMFMKVKRTVGLSVGQKLSGKKLPLMLKIA